MKILLLGASGATGIQIIEMAINKGHEISAYVRNPKKLEKYKEKIEIIHGELSSTKKLSESVKGKDSVISALGYRNLWDKSLFVSKTIETVLNAMALYNVSKLIYESASGIGGNHSVKNPILRTVLRTFGVANPFMDHNKTEKLIKKSNVFWTIVRPGFLTNGRMRGKYRIEENSKRINCISRADVAHFIINALDDKKWSNKSINLSY
jgi:putative NADH-flavin reductase